MAATAPPGAGPSVDFSSHRPQKVMEKGRRALQRGFGALSLCRMKRWISDRRLHQPPLPGKGHGSSGDQMSQSAARAGSSLLPVRLCVECGSPGIHVPRTLRRMPGPWGGVRQAASPKTLRRKKRRIRRYWPGFRVCRKSAGQRPPRLEDSMGDFPAEPYKGSVPGRPYSAGE